MSTLCETRLLTKQRVRLYVTVSLLGCAFVVFLTREGAEKAIAAADDVHKDHHFSKADIRWATGTRANFKLFAGCLPQGITDVIHNTA